MARKDLKRQPRPKKFFALKDFCDFVLKKNKKIIKAIWLLRVEDFPRLRDISIVILVDDTKADKKNIKNLEASCAEAEKNVSKRYNLKIHAGLAFLSSYFESIMLNKLDVFSEIKGSAALYDPSGFFVPLQKLIEKGKILGTKESLARLIFIIKERLRDLQRLKVEVLGKIYEAVIDAGQSPLIIANLAVPVQKEVSVQLEKNFVKKNMLDSKYIEYYNKIIDYWKSYEHGKIKEIDASVLDELAKKANAFVERMAELCESIKRKT